MDKCKKLITRFLGILLVGSLVVPTQAQHSVARKWNEILLEGIRNDLARPTVHARNLFHISAAMYDSWAILSNQGNPYLIGNEVHGVTTDFAGFQPASNDVQGNLDKAISYAAYRLLLHRFAKSPGWEETFSKANQLFKALSYDPAFTSVDYSQGSAAALGNFIAQSYISYGHLDGSNEKNNYENLYYEPVNDFLDPTSGDAPLLNDPNRWQPLAFEIFIDQSGNEIPGTTPEFLSPEWGQVAGFALNEEDKTTYHRDGFDFQVFFDPKDPPYLMPNGSDLSDSYKWGFSMVAIWSSHLAANNTTMIDISPSSIGNVDINSLPTKFTSYDLFYDYLQGGDTGKGYSVNPATGKTYETQQVKLGNYSRVLAEFWADGPDSETPPGHWFTLLNYVSDHPAFKKKYKGTGPELSNLEWDVKSYFILGGAMHDAAIAAWSIKGYYDYIRPISAIRYMASKGQSSDQTLPNFHQEGMPLVKGYIELVGGNDLLVGDSNENINKVKLNAWKGPDYITNPETDAAGVDWILAENWWPYQRPTFITPPFAGYVSGHSTYSRAAAEVLTLLTGDPFFPGGIGEFEAKKNEFLVFEEGPSEDVILQWATYRDASDQCSLSRIWGGIHPPADDLPGRIIGEKIGISAFEFSNGYFENTLTNLANKEVTIEVYPNPFTYKINFTSKERIYSISIMDATGRVILKSNNKDISSLDVSHLKRGIYLIKLSGASWQKTFKIVK
jgi:hypothetical protein